MKRTILLIFAFTMVITMSVHAQNINVLDKYVCVSLRPASTNTAVPDYEKLQPDLESGIKDLLRKNKIPVLKNQQEAADKGWKKCEILICTYELHYSTGMMFNANITCSLHFITCDEKEIFSISGKKMVPAVVGAKGYLGLFTTLMKPYGTYVYAFKPE